MDALGLLRDYTVRNDVGNIKLVDGEVRFGDDYRFPANLETAYRIAGNKQGGHYTLQSLLFFVKNTNLKHTEYMQQARSLKLQIVTFTDRKPLQDYLEGRVSTNDAIELLAPLALPLSSAADLPLPAAAAAAGAAAGTAAAGAGEEDGPPHKRSRFSHAAASAAASLDNPAGSIDATTEASSMYDSLADILQERPVRDRETILLCPTKSFRSILESLGSKRDEDKRRGDNDSQQPGRGSKDAPVAAGIAVAGGAAEKAAGPGGEPSAHRYADPEEKTFWKDHLGTDAEDLGIDPTQGFINDGSNHKQQHDSWGHGRGAQRPPHHQHHHRPAMGSGPAHSQQRHDAAPGVPIILVPSASQTLLNTFNAKEFLEDGVYVPPDLTKKKTEVLSIKRKIGRENPIKYEVRDKPSSLSPKDWERVVAVFVLGKEWQFKDWPFKDHAEIFDRTLGVHLRFEDDSVESAKAVRKWNVKIISLSRHKRHQDRTAVLEFWDRLDAFLRSRKSNLIS